MTDIHAKAFRRSGGGLFPADLHADEFLQTLPEGKEVLVTVKRPRSIRHHRLLFAVLRLVCRNSEVWNDEEELLSAVKLAAGLTEPRMTLDGEIYRAPKSISFAAMGQDEFGRFFKRAAYLLGRMIGVDPVTLIAEAQAEMQTHRRPSPSIVPGAGADEELEKEASSSFWNGSAAAPSRGRA